MLALHHGLLRGGDLIERAADGHGGGAGRFARPARWQGEAAGHHLHVLLPDGVDELLPLAGHAPATTRDERTLLEAARPDV